MTSYLKLIWDHDFDDEPVWLYSELDEGCFEISKVEVFRDGRRIVPTAMWRFLPYVVKLSTVGSRWWWIASSWVQEEFMPNRYQAEAAVGIARGLIGEAPSFGSPGLGLIGLVRRFSVVEFEVPDSPDADGYLFQYGTVNWFPDPTFVLGLVRQLEVVDSSRECESYVQVQFEFRYPLDDDLEAVGSHSEWWFPGGGASLDAWLESLEQSSIMGILSAKTSREFEIWEDRC